MRVWLLEEQIRAWVTESNEKAYGCMVIGKFCQEQANLGTENVQTVGNQSEEDTQNLTYT